MRCEKCQHFHCGSTCLNQVETNAPSTVSGETRELHVGHGDVDDRNPACVRAHLAKRIERTAVVGTIGRWCHDDIAGDAEASLLQLIVADVSVGWRRLRKLDLMIGNCRQRAIECVISSWKRLRRTR